MILKGFKSNAVKKSFESHLKKRNAESQNISDLTTLAVLVDASRPINMMPLLKLANELGVASNRLKIIGYKEEKELQEEKDIELYNDKSFGVNGIVKSTSLQKFIDKNYDVLINFYEEDKMELNYVAAASKAKLKVGFAKVDNRINDLIIGSEVNDANLFMAELKKYLKILQLI